MTHAEINEMLEHAFDPIPPDPDRCKIKSPPHRVAPVELSTDDIGSLLSRLSFASSEDMGGPNDYLIAAKLLAVFPEWIETYGYTDCQEFLNPECREE